MRRPLFKRSLFPVLAILPLFGFGTSSLHNAFALNGLQCTDTTQAKDATITDVMSTDTISCVGGSDNPKTVTLKVQIYDPKGNGAFIHIQSFTPGESYTIEFTPASLSSSPNGAWTVIYTFINGTNFQTGRETANFDISFFVLPESPIGVAALMGSSLAALGAFAMLKRRSGPHYD